MARIIKPPKQKPIQQETDPNEDFMFNMDEIEFDDSALSFDDGDDEETGELPAIFGNIDYQEKLEHDALAEADALMSEFQKRAKAEEKRREIATDSEFWFAVCFQTREQKDEFLKNAGLFQIGDKYLDGVRVARKLGVSISPANVSYPESRIDKKYMNLT